MHKLTHMPKSYLIYLTAFVMGLGLQFIWPIFVSFGWILVLIGMALAGCGVYLYRLSVSEVKVYIPEESSPPTILTTGPYRYSRHPIYLALSMIYVGLGLVLGNVWVVILSLPIFLYLNNIVIEREEYNMCEIFGEDYHEYRQLVRKWI